MGRWTRRISMAVAAGVLLAGVGVPEADAHERHRRHHRDHGAVHDDHRGVPRYYHGRRGGRVRRDAAYYCASCRHRFHARRAFNRHLHHRHHIPLWKIPFVIVHGAVHGIVGWIFYG